MEVKLNGRTNLPTIALKNKLREEEEVTITVNTGIQSLPKERSAGSYSKPNMDILRDRSTSMNILQRLDGLVPGFTLNSAPLSRTP
jgi:hypothetical protein